MPNPTGRAAKKAQPAVPATPAADEHKTERHVRSPLERAQAVYDKAKATSDKVAAKLTAAKADVTALEAEAAEAKVTLDWAASHPLLVAARKEAEAGEGVEWDIDANRPAARDDGDTSAATDELAAVAEVPAAPTDQPPAGPDAADDEPAAGDFDFDAAAATPVPPQGSPFDPARTTHV